MQTEQNHTEPNWKLLPGVILDGGYEMEDLLQADERRARFKVRVLGDRTIDAFASFFPVYGTSAEEQVEVWGSVRSVPHPNLSRPLAIGRRQLEGVELVYVVLKRADETLNGALRERPLTAGEASEVLLSCSRAIEHLRRNSLVHASISPDDVFAVDDSIQLSSEGVRKIDEPENGVATKAKYVAPESVNGNITVAASIWCLGATIFETLTQKPYAVELRDQAGALPLGWVLQRCLDPEPEGRCQPEEMAALLKSGPPQPVPAVKIPPVAEVAAASVPASVADVSPESAPAEGIRSATPAVLAAAAGVGLPAGGTTSGPQAPGLNSETAANESPYPDPQLLRSPASSVSQARTRALKQAEYEARTIPQGVESASPAKASSAAPMNGSIAPVLGSFENPSPRLRVSQGGARLQGSSSSTTAGTGAARTQTFNAEPNIAPAKLRRGANPGAREGSPQYQSGRLWIYAAGALAVLLLLFWALRSKPVPTPIVSGAVANPAVHGGATPPATTSTEDSTANKAWPTRTLEPDKPASVTRPATAETAKPTNTASSKSGPALWRVVVYTFNRQEDAEKKAHTLNAKHPHLQAQVFSPNGHAGPYLVTIGGRMSREDAAKLRSRALGSGIPRDTYIQNYKE